MTRAPVSGACRHDGVVIGAGMAGLLAARVLAERFEHVTIVERDELADGGAPRKGVPQGRHPHALLAPGAELLEQLFPGLTGELVAAGAQQVDFAAHARWWQPGGYRLTFETGRFELIATRPLLEAHLRDRVRALPNVSVLAGHAATALRADRGRIAGIAVRSRRGEARELRADLVVDAAGRGTHAPAWLQALGFPRPERQEVAGRVHYTTRVLRRRPGDLPGARVAVVQAAPPRERRFGVALPVEGERWLVLLGGYGGERCPTDFEGFQAFAAGLPAPDLHHLLRGAEPLAPAATFAFPAQTRQHFERLARHPEGFLVLGDALCAFNPVYAQGMTCAALQAAALRDCLCDPRPRLADRFYRRAARAVDPAWRLAAGADFAHPTTTGARPGGTALMNAYIARLQRAATRDPHAARALVAVTRMLAPPSAVFRPRAIAAALRPAPRGEARRLEPLGAGRALASPRGAADDRKLAAGRAQARQSRG